MRRAAVTACSVTERRGQHVFGCDRGAIIVVRANEQLSEGQATLHPYSEEWLMLLHDFASPRLHRLLACQAEMTEAVGLGQTQRSVLPYSILQVPVGCQPVLFASLRSRTAM